MDILAEEKRPIPAEWEEDVKRRIQNYLFYYSHQKGCRTGHCSRCGAEMEAFKKDTSRWHDFYNARHNDDGLCPVCEKPVQFKAIGKLRNISRLNHVARMLFIDVISPEKVWLRGYYIRIKYFSFYEPPELQFNEEVRYELTPGKAVMAACTYSNLLGYRPWKKRNSIGEPWPLTNFGSFIPYDIGDMTPLENTFLRYIPVEEFFDEEYTIKTRGYYSGYYPITTNRIPWGRILSYAAKYTFALEMALKNGMFNFCKDLICLNNKHAKHINWNAKEPRQFLRGVRREDFKAIMRCRNRGGDLLNIMDFYKYLKLPVETAKKYSDAFSYEDIKNTAVAIGDSEVEIMKYLLKQGYHRNGTAVLRDYRDAALALGRDLSVPSIRWPKDLTEAHDEYTMVARALHTEIKWASYREAYSEYRHLYEFVEDEYMAVVPERLADIKLEGELQHHCVAGYIDRHAEGKTIIIFIRRTMLPAIPLYTVEISPDGKLRQIQGYHNYTENKPTPEADEFVQRWLAEVQRRLAKDKKKEEAA